MITFDVHLPNRKIAKMRRVFFEELALETLLSFFSWQFQIVSNTARIHALETLLSFFGQVKQMSFVNMSMKLQTCVSSILQTTVAGNKKNISTSNIYLTLLS